MALTYIGNVSFRQVKPPAWGKTFAGDADTCTLSFAGAQYLAKAFEDALTKYQALTYQDERGDTYSEVAMFLEKWTSDDTVIPTTVTLTFSGCKGGTIPDAVPTDDKTIQSASTSATITDPTSLNVGKSISLSIQYYAARTTYEYTQLSDPGGNTTHGTVRHPLTYTLGGPNIISTKFTGMVDADGNPTNTISTADATFVWNTFTGNTVLTGLNSKEVVPGKLWKVTSTVEYLLT
jgi:hypothetical protein